MTARNEEIVRRNFASFQRLEMDGFTEDWHPDVVWDLRGYRDWPGEKTEYVGAPEVLAGFASYLGAARSLEVYGLEVTSLDDARVLGTHIERRVNEGEDTPVELDIGVVYTLSDGKVTHVEVYTGHDAARRAAGVEQRAGG
jgi:ketosteroid isomerase-like protein